jgi:hypothetical protein
MDVSVIEITYPSWRDSEILFFAAMVELAVNDVPYMFGALFQQVSWLALWNLVGIVGDVPASAFWSLLLS